MSKLEFMTDAELNLAIAELIEPKPADTTAPKRIYPFSPSEGGAWACVGWHAASMYVWMPRDFSNDPACIMVLMTRESFVELTLANGIYCAEFCPSITHGLECSGDFAKAEHATIGRAVAEAWYKSQGGAAMMGEPTGLANMKLLSEDDLRVIERRALPCDPTQLIAGYRRLTEAIRNAASVSGCPFCDPLRAAAFGTIAHQPHCIYWECVPRRS